MKKKIEIYTTKTCGYCHAAKDLLNKLNLEYSEIDVTNDQEKRIWLVTQSGQRTVPQIFIDNKPIGGYNELVQLNKSNKL